MIRAGWGVLLVRLSGQLQSWGDVLRHAHLTTRMEPTKSGLVGLICYVLGRPLTADISDLADLIMTVRVDREGKLMRDFHVVRGTPRANEEERLTMGAAFGRQRKREEADDSDDRVEFDSSSSAALLEELRRTVVTHRYYLQGAHFLVALEGPLGLLGQISQALRAPARVASLGRRCCLPGRPLWVAGGLVPGKTGFEVLSSWPAEVPTRARSLRVVRDLGLAAYHGELRHDWPVSLHPDHRQHCSYRVETTWVPVPALAGGKNENVKDEEEVVA